MKFMKGLSLLQPAGSSLVVLVKSVPEVHESHCSPLRGV